eukprot:554374-Rhodomonas_salina.3
MSVPDFAKAYPYYPCWQSRTWDSEAPRTLWQFRTWDSKSRRSICYGSTFPCAMAVPFHTLWEYRTSHSGAHLRLAGEVHVRGHLVATHASSVPDIVHAYGR